MCLRRLIPRTDVSASARPLRCKTLPRKSIHTEISPLRSPGFPVETRGFDGLHAALFTESRTRGRRQQREVGNPGRDDKGRGVTFRKASDLDGQCFEWLGCEDCRPLDCASLCRNKAANPDIEWVAQVSLLRPGFSA